MLLVFHFFFLREFSIFSLRIQKIITKFSVFVAASYYWRSLRKEEKKKKNTRSTFLRILTIILKYILYYRTYIYYRIKTILKSPTTNVTLFLEHFHTALVSFKSLSNWVIAKRTVQNLRLSWETFELAMISPSLKGDTTPEKL